MNNDISEYLQIFPKRIFIDVASIGCGNGCIYCFTKSPSAPQTLLPLSTIDHLCMEIMKMKACADSIISLCPNTDPMKSSKSRDLALHIIETLAPKVKIIQISTRERIPISYLKKLNELSTRKGQIRISISIPYLDNIELLEPGAISVPKRLENFNNINRFPNLVSVLYLRPFNEQMLANKPRYVELIKTYQPNDICLGVEFVPKVKTEQLCTYMYDNKISPHIFEAVGKDKIFEFADTIREETGKPVFYSSLCNIANCTDYGCTLKLFQYEERYCRDCLIKR